MSLRKTGEAHHHSAEQVRQYLDTALRLTAEFDLGDVSPDVFFAKAVDLVSVKQLTYEQMNAGVLPVLDGAR